MNFLQAIARVLQYPQSVATGLASSGGGMFGQNFDTGEDAGLNRILEGLKGDLRPSDIARRNNPNDPDNVASKIGATSMDILLDPTLLAGGAARKLAEGTRFAPVVAGAGTMGKVEKAVAPEGATGLSRILAERSPQLGQLARRTLQGTLATGDPLTGLGAGQLIGVGERGLDMILPKIASRLLTQGDVNTSGLGVVNEAVGDGVDKIISMPALDRVKIMGELNPAPGFGIEQPPVGGWNPRPAPVPQFDDSLQALLEGASRRTVDQGVGPITVRDPLPGLDQARRIARDLPAVDPRTLAMSMGLQGKTGMPEQAMAKRLLQQLQIEGTVGRQIGGTRLQEAIPQNILSKPEVPMFEDSLQQLVDSLQRGAPSLPREPLALNPAPVPMPMDVLSPSTEQATMASIQDLIAQLQDPRRRALVLGQLNGR